MGWFKKVGKIIGGSIISGAKESFSNNIITKSPSVLRKDAQLEKFLRMSSNKEIYNTPTSFVSNTISKSSTDIVFDKPDFLSSTRDKINTDSSLFGTIKDDNSDLVKITSPDWNYGDLINERTMWQRQISSISGEPGWFYFKIFFHFDTQQGLFGGILNDTHIYNSVNSAGKFLQMSTCLKNNLYSTANLEDRLTALRKFTSILSYITSNAPWFFKSVKGLDKANEVYWKDFSQQRSIEVAVNPDAIDMRLVTMMDLYKYAAFDNINCKEIIPENLRKFDMTILIFNTPIKKLHTAMKSKMYGDFGYKDMITSTTKFSNFMSYKMFTFKNCEFDKDSLNTLLSSDITNETPFQIGNNSIKINYDRVYTHTANEFFGLFFGDNGIYFNNYPNKGQENNRFKNSLENEYLQKTRYKVLQKQLSGKSMKSLINSPQKYKELIDASEALSNSIIVTNETVGFFEDVGKNTLLSLLKISYRSQSVFGNLYGNVAPGSQYFKDKIKYLKYGKDPSMETEYLIAKNKYDHFNFLDFLLGKANKIKYS